MTSKILITGATGGLGGSVLDHLLSLMPADRLIALGRNTEKLERFAKKGVELRPTDFDDAAATERALTGVHTVLLVPTVAPNRLEQHKRVVDIAKRTGVRHILYTGMIHHDETGHGPIVKDHQDLERHLAASDIPHTFIRNGIYHDVIPAFLGNAVESGVFRYPATVGLTLALRDDLAQATARIIADPALQGGIKELGLLEPVTYADVAAALSRVTGKTIVHADIPLADHKAALMQHGLPEPIAQAYTDLARATGAGMIRTRSTTLKDILGREPVSLETALRAMLKPQAA